MKDVFKFIKGMIFVVLVAVVLGVLWAGLSIYQYSSVDETQQADVAIVLGCAVEDGEPSPVFRERILHGIQLYHNGYVKNLIFTGGVGQDDEISEAQAAKKLALEWGVPEECIFIEEKSRITEQNLEYAQEIMEENQLETALLVSDPLHMKRAMLMAKDYGVTAYSSPTTTSLYQEPESWIPFLARETILYAYYSAARLVR